MIRRALQVVLGVFLLGIVAACYGGTGSVYVGVAAPGPWVRYPYPYPGVPGVTVGYPPYYWDDDEQDQDVDAPDESDGDRDEAQAIDTDREATLSVDEDRDQTEHPGEQAAADTVPEAVEAATPAATSTTGNEAPPTPALLRRR